MPEAAQVLEPARVHMATVDYAADDTTGSAETSG